MKIAMIGCGAAGSVFAAYLRRGGAELTLVDPYRAHMDAIRREGLRFRLRGEEQLLTGFACCDSAAELGPVDAVILMVKATQTAAVLPALRGCLGAETVVVSLQNGLDNDRILKDFVDPGRILCGFGRIGTELPAPGLCVAKPEEGVVMRFGPLRENERLRALGLRLQTLFCDGGCEARYEPDIRPFLWKKAIANAGYNTLSAVLGLKVGPLLDSEEGRALCLRVWEEGCAVAEAAGVGDLRAGLREELPRLRAGFADYYPSMAQDLRIHHRKTEILHLNGAIARIGRELGVPTPLNEALTEMVLLLEAQQS